jgi:hypothetical protein
MLQMIRSTGVKNTLLAEAPPGLVAFMIAEIFFKFGSFAWECIAFLLTWCVLSFVYDAMKRFVLKIS